MQRLLADVETSPASGRDVAITSSAVSIRTVLCFFRLRSRFATPFLARSRRFWCQITRAVVEIPKPLEMFENLVPLKSYSLFGERRFFAFLRHFA